MKPTIVFLHGLNCSSKIFGYLHGQLPSHTPYFIEYDSHQPIEESYSHIIKNLPKKQFNVIGHSLGGILGYLIASRNGGNIKKLISISTPFGGSSTANLLRWIYPHFKILKDISSTSKIVEEISKTPINIPFLSFVSTAGSMPFIPERNDGIVTLRSQLAISPTIRVELNANHFEAVQDKQCVDHITNFLFK